MCGSRYAIKQKRKERVVCRKSDCTRAVADCIVAREPDFLWNRSLAIFVFSFTFRIDILDLYSTIYTTENLDVILHKRLRLEVSQRVLDGSISA